MTIRSIQDKLVESIVESHASWSKLLVDMDLGSYAPNMYDIALNPINVAVNLTDKTFTFNSATFSFDLDFGVSHGEDVVIFSQQVTGKGTFQFINENSNIQLKELQLDEY
ncbi:hypothetical protein [Joostella sp.]|uniref:hypothetical protein n=1 Tax=Joostella sp. TaxID=2231138 RepID=UPI003A93B4C4